MDLGTIWIIILFSCIAWEIIREVLQEKSKDKAAKEVLKDFDVDKEKKEILAIKNNFIREEMKCPKCDGILRLRSGKFGEFLGCSNYPRCDFTKKKV